MPEISTESSNFYEEGISTPTIAYTYVGGAVSTVSQLIHTNYSALKSEHTLMTGGIEIYSLYAPGNTLEASKQEDRIACFRVMNPEADISFIVSCVFDSVSVMPYSGEPPRFFSNQIQNNDITTGQWMVDRFQSLLEISIAQNIDIWSGNSSERIKSLVVAIDNQIGEELKQGVIKKGDREYPFSLLGHNFPGVCFALSIMSEDGVSDGVLVRVGDVVAGVQNPNGTQEAYFGEVT